MKLLRFFCLSAVALLLFSCKGKKAESIEVTPLAMQNSLQVEQLTGPVKRTVEKKHMAIPGTDSIALYAILYKSYSKEGWLTESVITNDEGDTMSVHRISYNAQGRMEKDEVFNSVGLRTKHTDYQSDKNGYRIKESSFVGDSLVKEITYKNDAYGNVLEMSVQDQNLIVLKYSYGGRFFGMPTQIDNCDASGRRFMYTTLEYNDCGQLVNRRTFSANGAEAESSHSQYAQNGVLTKQVDEVKLQSKQGRNLSTFENHDAHGNWQKQTMLKQGALNYVIERTIEYY